MTKETGQAILTGKITGDAVDEADETAENGNYEKTLLVISVVVLVVVLIIIAMKFAKTKKKVKRVRKH